MREGDRRNRGREVRGSPQDKPMEVDTSLSFPHITHYTLIIHQHSYVAGKNRMDSTSTCHPPPTTLHLHQFNLLLSFSILSILSFHLDHLTFSLLLPSAFYILPSTLTLPNLNITVW
mmetsp:Transcript_6399/g.15725  ORF Transcript_6399/g.15725 Transcript_6399/m.15725 type:complete len:117 (-) Transcript_6399:2571-2921(-)